MTSKDSPTVEPSAGVLEHLDPHTVVIDENVRSHVSLDAEFVASVADGVLQPVTAVRRADGTVAVQDGQRRVLAARQAGLAVIPVYVRPTVETDDKARALDRITHQLVSNEHRANLTGAERVTALAQMLDLGLSATAVSKKVHIKRAEVRAAGIVAKAESARAAVDSGALTLAQGEVLAEFEDSPDVVARLLTAAESGRFDHVAAQVRREQEQRRRAEEAAASYTELGHPILAEEPDPYAADPVRLTWLRRPDGGEVTLEMVSANPAAWAVYMVYEENGSCIVTATGEEIDPDTVDWDTEGDPSAEPDGGMRHADTVELQPAWTPAFYCVDLDAAGVVDRRQHHANEPADHDENESHVAAQQEAEKAAQRRNVRVLNTFGRAATDTRREWVRQQLARRTPPKSAAAFTANMIALDNSLLSDFHAPDGAADLLGINAAGFRDSVQQLLVGASEQRAQVIVLGLVLGALEERTGPDAWRGTHRRGVPEYLRYLRDIGYPLSEIEEVITGDRTAEEVLTAAANEPLSAD
ncbi:ParB/RepB/Spo0J family partition protein [Nocardia arthritidis]|uniref:ParB-like N-terminal domain-containing protein n=1 Tax=Nocardia arthritidis TaxID=228602 RepID=A0A6G9YL37_9NOCA|nr:ParB N-terminal domain-containing protein [Nocardia arthritidis]QIS13908.1 hypothetical protein F5544_30320 [Nocardia arthritidis]